MKRIWSGFCRRPLLWLSLALTAGMIAEWLVMYRSNMTYSGESVFFTLAEYVLTVMMYHTAMTGIAFPLLLMAVGLVFLLRRGNEDTERKAGIRVEGFTLAFCAARIVSWLFALMYADGGIESTGTIPSAIMLSGAMILPAAVGYIYLRAARRSLSSSTAKLALITIGLGVVGCGLLSAQFFPGMMLCPLCMAVVGLNAIRDGIKTPAGTQISENTAEAACTEASPVGEISVVAETTAVQGSDTTCSALSESPAEASAADSEVRNESSDDSQQDIPASAKRTSVLFLLISLGILMLYFMLPLMAENIIGDILLLGLAVLFILAPFALTVCNIVRLFTTRRPGKPHKSAQWIEFVTLGWGFFCTILWAGLGITNIVWKDWNEQLYNNEVHSPVATDTIPTLVTLMLVSLAGYLVLRLIKQDKLPPLVSALSMAALYIGGAECIVWIIQVFFGDPVMCIFPFNILLIYARVTGDAVADWRTLNREKPQHKSAVIRALVRVMNKSAGWPLPALILSLPLLGVIIAFLTLFGQAPDSIIQAWTQTSDWFFSMQIAPQNLHYDEHYLCTVAAGGHRRVVKPIRKGKRHGHDVVVNRQLCVANAFEQLLEERTPRFHSLVRGIYDKYGYPIARHIKTPIAADAVWVLMKPLEWLFLVVLYLCDANPENRIAVQYPHAPIPSAKKTEEIERKGRNLHE